MPAVPKFPATPAANKLPEGAMSGPIPPYGLPMPGVIEVDESEEDDGPESKDEGPKANIPEAPKC